MLVLEMQARIAPRCGTYHWDRPRQGSEGSGSNQHEHEHNPKGLVSGITGELVDGLTAGEDAWDGGNRRRGRGSSSWQREQLRSLLEDLLELVGDHDGGGVDVMEFKDLHSN